MLISVVIYFLRYALVGMNSDVKDTTRTYRENSRVNGWSWPPDPLQVIVWIAIVFVSAYCFASLAPDFVEWLEYSAYGVSFSVFFLNFGFSIIL